MSDDRPFALHITWTCYGTWLPGDAHGYVSNTLLPEGGFLPKKNTPGTPCTSDDAYTHSQARRLQKWPTIVLDSDLARVVAETLVKAARDRGWRIVRAAVMPNHIHVVVMNCPDDGPAVRRILKGTTQAALSKHVGQHRRWWTEDGSDRYKHNWNAIEDAVNYVGDQPYMLVEIVDMEVRIVGDH